MQKFGTSAMVSKRRLEMALSENKGNPQKTMNATRILTYDYVTVFPHFKQPIIQEMEDKNEFGGCN